MKSTFSMPALTARRRTCKKHPMRNAYIYDFSRNNGESPRGIATLQPLLLLLPAGASCSNFFISSYFASFVTLGVLKCCGRLAFGFYMRILMTAAVNLLRCGWSKTVISFLRETTTVDIAGTGYKTHLSPRANSTAKG